MRWRSTALAIGFVLGCAALVMAYERKFTAMTPSDLADLSDSSRVTVTFAARDIELTPVMIADFERAHPNIAIRRMDQEQGKMALLSKSREAPDILLIRGAKELPYYALHGLAMNLDDRINQSPLFQQEDMFPITGAFRFNGSEQGKGSYYGFLKDWSPDFTIMYNKTLFHEAGIPYPDPETPMTWQQLLDLAERLNDPKAAGTTASHEQYGLGIHNYFTALNQEVLLLQLAQLRQSPWYDNHRKADFTSPEVRRIFDFWGKAVDRSIGPTPRNGELRTPASLFLQGKMAMFMVGYWFYSSISQQLGSSALADFGFAPVPVFADGKRLSPVQAGVGGIISAQTIHSEEAWKVFEWFFAGPPVDERALNGWGLPAFRSKMKLLPQNTEAERSALAFVQSELAYSDVFLDNNPYLLENTLNNGLDKYVFPAYFNPALTDSVFYKLSEEMNRKIQESMNMSGQ